jgi:hypothetical protein
MKKQINKSRVDRETFSNFSFIAGRYVFIIVNGNVIIVGPFSLDIVGFLVYKIVLIK